MEEDLKKRISLFLAQIMEKLQVTQKDMAKLLGVNQSRIQALLKGKELPKLKLTMRLAELGDISIDDLLKTEKPPKVSSVVEMKADRGGIVVGKIGGDSYINTKILRRHTYKQKEDDITSEQARKLKDLVDDIVGLELKVKRKPRGYGAVWNALNKKMKVTYYREIKKEYYKQAELYLVMWKGRIKRPLIRTDEELWRKERQKAIFSVARKQLGMSKSDIDNFILGRFEKKSIKELTKEELQNLYDKIFAMKKTKK